MDLFDNVKALFGVKKKSDGNRKVVFRKNVSIEKRFEFVRTAVSGTMSKFLLARDRETDLSLGSSLQTPIRRGSLNNVLRPSKSHLKVNC